MLEKLVRETIKAVHATQGIKHVPVKYVRAVNALGEEVLVSETDLKQAEELGLSLRRIHE